MLRHLPRSADPNLLVGIETRDDAGVYRLPGGRALVQTVDFFTPIVDDPYAFGQIAAANALSDVYAMGGQPITALNIACFDPSAESGEVWAQILLGAHDKTVEAGAVVVGGHSVEDDEPKFGMAVTGLVDPDLMFTNAAARPGDSIYLSKPLGTGIVTTAAKADAATPEELQAAIAVMANLNRDAAEAGARAKVRCATDITGFGLAGHLYNVARASGVRIEIEAEALPVLAGVERLIGLGYTTGGAEKNRAFVGNAFSSSRNDWRLGLAFDPQTSGGLALFSTEPLPYPRIGRVTEGEASIQLS